MPSSRAAAAIDDLSTLAWVHEELRKSLEAAHKALRRYLRDIEAASGSDLDDVDPAVLRSARQQIHQSMGVLELVNITEGAHLLRAAETLVQRFVAKPQRLDLAGVVAIEKASFALLDYLGRRLAGKPVQAVGLFPALKTLLELTGAERIHPADLWAMDWRWRDIAPLSVRPRPADAAMLSSFERRLLSLVRTNALDQAVALRSDCCALAAAFAAQAEVPAEAVTFWRIAAGFFEAWALDLLPQDVFVKRTASRLLGQLRSQVKGDPAVSDRLAQDLLFFCARAILPVGAASPCLHVVRLGYGLEVPAGQAELVPAPGSEGEAPLSYSEPVYGRFDPSAVSQARKRVEAAKQAFATVAGGELHRMDALAEPFSLVQESLSRLYPADCHLGESLLAVARNTAARGRASEPAVAMEVATSLLYLDAVLEDGDFDRPDELERLRHLATRLDAVQSGEAGQPLEPWMEAIYRRVSDRHTLGSVVHELRARLQEVERLLDRYFRAPEQPEVLGPVPGELSDMRGVFTVLGVEPAERAVGRMRDDVLALAHPTGPVDPYGPESLADMQRLAGNLGALGFLVDMLHVQPQLAKVLFIFDAKTGQLAPLMGRHATVPDLVDRAQAISEAALRENAPLSEVSAQLDALARQPLVEDQPELALSLTLAREAVEQVAAGTSADQRDAARSHVVEAMNDFVSAATSPMPLDPLDASFSRPMPLETPAEDADLAADPELREVFLEEAVDVLEQARDGLAVLAVVPGDIAQLTAMRRVFHTLKGSARMVGLGRYGEAAWAFEQLYNHWIASEKPASSELQRVTADAVTYFSAWTQAVAATPSGSLAPEPVIAAAQALRLDGTLLRIQLPGAEVAPEGQADGLTLAESAALDLEFPDVADKPVMEPLEASRPVPLETIAADPEPTSGREVSALDISLDQAYDAPPDAHDEEAVRLVGPLRVPATLFGIYTAEADEWSRQLVSELDEWTLERERPVAASCVRLAHSLAGSSSTVGYADLSRLAHELEHALERSQAHGACTTADLGLFQDAALEIRRLLQQFSAGFLREPDDELERRLQAWPEAPQTLVFNPGDTAPAVHVADLPQVPPADQAIPVADEVIEDDVAVAPQAPLTHPAPTFPELDFNLDLDAPAPAAAVVPAPAPSPVEVASAEARAASVPPIIEDLTPAAPAPQTPARIEPTRAPEVAPVRRWGAALVGAAAALVGLGKRGDPPPARVVDPIPPAPPEEAESAPEFLPQIPFLDKDAAPLAAGSLPGVPLIPAWVPPAPVEPEPVLSAVEPVMAPATEPAVESAVEPALEPTQQAPADAGPSALIPVEDDPSASPVAAQEDQDATVPQAVDFDLSLDADVPAETPGNDEHVSPDALDARASPVLAESAETVGGAPVNVPESDPASEPTSESAHGDAPIEVPSADVVAAPVAAADAGHDVRLDALHDALHEAPPIEATDAAAPLDTLEVAGTEATERPTEPLTAATTPPSGLAPLLTSDLPVLDEVVEMDEAEAEALNAPSFAPIETTAVDTHVVTPPRAEPVRPEPVRPEPVVLRDVVVLEALQTDIDQRDQVDTDLFPVFEEEADDLLPQLAQHVQAWQAHPQDQEAGSACMRVLHTFKGGARLAGAMRLGEMAHRCESAIQVLMNRERVDPDDLTALQGRIDTLAHTFERLRRQFAGESLSGFAPLSSDAGEWSTRTGALSEFAPDSEDLPRVDEPAAADEQRALAPIDWSRLAAPGSALTADGRNAPVLVDRPVTITQPVRVRIQVLDRLVNLAGEVNITRARLDSEVGNIRGSLVDLADNLDRLNQQLNDIALQADSQLQSRREAARVAAQDFDPLELDRYTRLQELTRILAESVNDVATVRSTLLRTTQTAEDELASQARLTRELQSDLLRTRMVEFDSLSERFYRVVRQAAKETGKLVRLDIAGGSIEVDRSVLDRMVPAFEHLLRNCVSHGIEMPEDRQAVGKDSTGTIVVSAQQEGNEVTVEVRDDGRGLDLASIRTRAETMGLIAPTAALSDQELAQLILAPGLSTAHEVTELAGRGVGMDVVRADVQSMGGRVEIRADAGQGTHFKLVLPLTTVVTQVVMLRAGSTVIAVPSNLIELVQRATPQAVETAYGEGVYLYGGLRLPFLWLGALLGQAGMGPLAGRTQPVVILRSAQHRIALHVDDVQGTHEVVVKNLGPQMAGLPGLSGLTMLATGQPALIYNPVTLAAIYGERAREQGRAALTAPPSPDPALLGTVAMAPLVLVVDDSLTVRRVTKRLLEREGYRVALAKDGREALDLLSDERPAVVLSDIEMPRMDGFDLLRNIRGDAMLNDLPVIMITSRIAEKHRDHAMRLGVNHYLGKPYSEDELLTFIRRYADRPKAGLVP